MRSHMRVFLASLTSAVIAFGGCGDGEGKKAADKPSPSSTAEAGATPAGPCPDGTKLVTADELVADPAPGYSLAPSDPAATKTIVTRLKTALGDGWRGHDAKVLARDGASRGTLLLVINTTEKTGGNDDIAAGMLDRANESGYKTEPITVGGQETRLVRNADSYATVGVAGECAAVMVVSTSEKAVHNAVEQIG